jgi:hypothetical protein
MTTAATRGETVLAELNREQLLELLRFYSKTIDKIENRARAEDGFCPGCRVVARLAHEALSRPVR